MSINIHYGPIAVTLEQDAEGFSYSCPLCHNLYFTIGSAEACKNLIQDHLQQSHHISLPQAIITKDNLEPPKIQVQHPR